MGGQLCGATVCDGVVAEREEEEAIGGDLALLDCGSTMRTQCSGPCGCIAPVTVSLGNGEDDRDGAIV